MHNVTIIGGGPAGLAAAVYNARASLKPLVIAGSPPGGQLMLTSEVENYPGFESILGAELIANMRKQAEKFGAVFQDIKVKSISKEGNNFKLVLTNDREISSRAVLVATGADAMWLGLDSEQRLRGKGVSACATCDGFFYKDRIIGVVGGGDSAMEEALVLTKFAKKVYVIHRRDEFRASKIMQKRVLDHEKIEVVWNAQVDEVLGKDKVEGVKLSEGKGTSKIPNELKLDGLFVAIGHKPNSGFLKGSGVEVDEKGYVFTSARMAIELIKQINNNKTGGTKVPDKKLFDFNYQYQTSVKGIFAAGDVVDFSYRQAATAVGMGVAASLEVEKYLET